ncbi:SPOR domain-containing protein [Desulfurella sp.]|uniref:SPOR domain-containing protein n=1 Tax=Desulfurella sp. TaxID=1962857 RepID=UPI003D0ABB92
MEQEKFKFEQNHQNSQKKKNFGIWTLIISIVIAFGFGYGVGFVSSAYFRNININKELANNIQILQSNSTSVKNEQTVKAPPVNQSKIAIQVNNTNSTKSEIKAIVSSLTNQTNATKTTSIKENPKPKEPPNSSQTKTQTKESKNTAVNIKEIKTQDNYIVQVASFPDRSKALNLVISLIQKGYNASSEQITINNNPYTRVIIAAHSLSQANKIAEKLKTEGITNLPIIYERKQ